MNADVLRISANAFDAGYEVSLLKRTIGRKKYITKVDAYDFFTRKNVIKWIKDGYIHVERTETNRLVVSTDALIRAYASEETGKSTKVRISEKIK